MPANATQSPDYVEVYSNQVSLDASGQVDLHLIFSRLLRDPLSNERQIETKVGITLAPAAAKNLLLELIFAISRIEYLSGPVILPEGYSDSPMIGTAEREAPLVVTMAALTTGATVESNQPASLSEKVQ